MEYCDLHTHSVFSDGTDTPEQILDRAVALELKAVALTDHDSVDGLPDFLAAAKEKPIEAIPGTEFAVVYEGTELHLLGLYIPTAAFAEIAALMRQVQKRREDRVHSLVDSLNRAGYALDFERLKQHASGQLTRAHVAMAIEEKGYMRAEDAFCTLLKPGNGHYLSPERLGFQQVLELILDCGAVPVLAHPFLNMTVDQLTAFLPQAKRMGLMAMECIYSGYDEQTTGSAFAMAEAFGLLPSGGSDYHGEIRQEAKLGNGDRKIPYAYADAFKYCKRE